jgi:hypothetical protein
MCLNYVFGETVEVQGKKFFIGYKSFEKNYDGKPSSFWNGGPYELDKVLLPNNSLLRTEQTNEEYKSGFHIFLNKKDIEEYYKNRDGMDIGVVRKRDISVVCRVLFADIRYIGLNGTYWFRPIETDTHGLAVVANELLILSKDWNEACLTKST